MEKMRALWGNVHKSYTVLHIFLSCVDIGIGISGFSNQTMLIPLQDLWFKNHFEFITNRRYLRAVRPIPYGDAVFLPRPQLTRTKGSCRKKNYFSLSRFGVHTGPGPDPPPRRSSLQALNFLSGFFSLPPLFYFIYVFEGLMYSVFFFLPFFCIWKYKIHFFLIQKLADFLCF